ncbi:UNVERIFIED_CONTAM: hypothetical protein FKN15_017099 [Acipenser sinensis]
MNILTMIVKTGKMANYIPANTEMLQYPKRKKSILAAVCNPFNKANVSVQYQEIAFAVITDCY